MNFLHRSLSGVTVKPDAEPEAQLKPYIGDNGYIDFRPGDIENPRNWSLLRRWYITLVSVFLAMNGNVASSITSGTTQSITEEFHIS